MLDILQHTCQMIGQLCSICCSASRNVEDVLTACIGEDKIINAQELEVGDVIMETASSTVYEAVYKNEVVVVKVINENEEWDVMVSSLKKAKFVREAQMLLRAQHDGVVKFIAASTKPKMQIVMERMWGGDLVDYCINHKTADGGLGLKVAIDFAIQISRVMEHLHGVGIVYRDLKLENLLLNKDMTKVKLADFGHARTMANDGRMSPNAGTLNYRAPEMSSEQGQKKQYDRKVDVFSFSMVLYELVTNRLPFPGPGTVQLSSMFCLYKYNQRPPIDNIPAGLVPLLQSWWVEDAASRPEFSEITSALEKFLSTLD